MTSLRITDPPPITGDNGITLTVDDARARIAQLRAQLNGTGEVPVRPVEATEPAEAPTTPERVFDVTHGHTADGHHHPTDEGAE